MTPHGGAKYSNCSWVFALFRFVIYTRNETEAFVGAFTSSFNACVTAGHFLPNLRGTYSSLKLKDTSTSTLIRYSRCGILTPVEVRGSPAHSSSACLIWHIYTCLKLMFMWSHHIWYWTDSEAPHDNSLTYPDRHWQEFKAVCSGSLSSLLPSVSPPPTLRDHRHWQEARNSEFCFPTFLYFGYSKTPC